MQQDERREQDALPAPDGRQEPCGQLDATLALLHVPGQDAQRVRRAFPALRAGLPVSLPVALRAWLPSLPYGPRPLQVWLPELPDGLLLQDEPPGPHGPQLRHELVPRWFSFRPRWWPDAVSPHGPGRRDSRTRNSRDPAKRL